MGGPASEAQRGDGAKRKSVRKSMPLRGRRGAKEVAQKHREEQYADLFYFYALNSLQRHIYYVGRDKLVDCDGHFARALALDFCQNALQAF